MKKLWKYEWFKLIVGLTLMISSIMAVNYLPEEMLFGDRGPDCECTYVIQEEAE